MLRDDPTEYFAALGNATATFGAESHSVVFDDAEAFATADGVIDADPSIQYARGWFSGLSIGSTVDIDGSEYWVRDLRRIEDGRLMLARVALVAT